MRSHTYTCTVKCKPTTTPVENYFPKYKNDQGIIALLKECNCSRHYFKCITFSLKKFKCKF